MPVPVVINDTKLRGPLKRHCVFLFLENEKSFTNYVEREPKTKVVGTCWQAGPMIQVKIISISTAVIFRVNTLISSTGNVSLALDKLKEKALHALFSLRKHTHISNLSHSMQINFLTL